MAGIQKKRKILPPCSHEVVAACGICESRRHGQIQVGMAAHAETRPIANRSLVPNVKVICIVDVAIFGGTPLSPDAAKSFEHLISRQVHVNHGANDSDSIYGERVPRGGEAGDAEDEM